MTTSAAVPASTYCTLSRARPQVVSSLNKLYATRRDHAVYEFCALGTKSRCREARGHHMGHCALIHFVRIMRPHTMPTPGDCSNLDYACPVVASLCRCGPTPLCVGPRGAVIGSSSDGLVMLLAGRWSRGSDEAITKMLHCSLHSTCKMQVDNASWNAG